MVNLKRWLPLFRGHAFCSKCHLSVEFTGAPAGNPSEALIERIAQGRRKVSMHWLEDEIATSLYYAELGRGGGASDIGLWGSALFCRESARVVADMRPQFGVIRPDSAAPAGNGPACEATPDSSHPAD